MIYSDFKKKIWKENEPRTTFRYGFQPGWVATSDDSMSSYDSKD